MKIMICSFLIATLTIGCSPAVIPASKSPSVVLNINLDKHSVTIDEPVKVTISGPSALADKINHIEFIIYRVGRFDKAMDTLINYDVTACQKNHLLTHDGLPGFKYAGRGRFNYEIIGDISSKSEIVKPTCLGIFMIKTRWKNEDSSVLLESPPVILTIHPPKDKNGVRLPIREEWLVDSK